MTTYYVGAGGSNGNSGLTWALRKLTLNGAEDVPLVAGDTVHVGPGVYREQLTCDVSGSAGNPITYIADVTGQNTDGVGGIVRITGSDNDQTATRANCVVSAARNHRTFRGFAFDIATGALLSAINASAALAGWTIEDCQFQIMGAFLVGGNFGSDGGAPSDIIIRRCVFLAYQRGYGINISTGAVTEMTGSFIENCVFIGGTRNILLSKHYGITIRNNFMLHGEACVATTGNGASNTVNVKNNVICTQGTALSAATAGEITEDYNSIIAATARTNVSTGANSNAFPPLFNPLTLLAGFTLPQHAPWSLSEWSQIKAIAGTSPATADLYGLTRPATAEKISWGPVQWVNAKRDTGTVRTGTASMKLADAGLKFVRRVWVTNVSTTISLYVRWEADYAGTKPRMVLRQAGQADRTTTATGASGAWEQLTDTFTPAALPGFVDVFVESSNTASATSFAAYVDDLVVS